MRASGQMDYWQVLLGSVEDIELKPIARSSCIQWLVDKERSTGRHR